MPTITVKLSKKSYDKLGRKRRRHIGETLNTWLALELNEPIGAVTTYWDPYPDAQNGPAFEAEVNYTGSKKVIRHLLPILLRVLCNVQELSGDQEISVWFPLQKGQPYATAKWGSR